MRKEIPKTTKKSKNASNKSKVKKKTTKAKTMVKETTIDSDVDTATSTDTEVESAEETDDKIQTPKRKRPSDYIAKKDRPENLKSDKKINQLSLDEAIEICKLSAKRAKLDTTSLDTDDAPEKKYYKKFTDDGVSKLHPARFDRQPIAPPSKWWSQVPVKRTNIIKKIPLRHLGKWI